MKAVIVEDEKSNSKRLKDLLKNMNDDFKVLSVLESVEESINWFANNDHPEIVFMDVQLSDGLCFEIFDEINISSPIIFTTAYDEYAIKAFKVNSIDYLLKPVDPLELEKSIAKYKKIYNEKNSKNGDHLLKLIHDLKIEKPKFKTRILLKSGKTFTSLQVNQIAYIFVENQLTNLISFDKVKFILDGFLDETEKELDTFQFFRINRQMIINFDAIQKIVGYQGSRLRLALNPPISKEVIVSREKVKQFKEWLNR